MEEEKVPFYEWGMKLYESFQPLRDIIAEHPELKGPIVEAIAKEMNQSFHANFYGPSPH